MIDREGDAHTDHRQRGGGRPRDFVRVLTEGCADAALAASIFHYGTYTSNGLKKLLAKEGIPVRLLENSL